MTDNEPIVTPGGLEKYNKNPFLNMTEIKTKKSQVRINRDDADHVLLNRSTGEYATTHVVSYREVDDAEFIKLFTANIALTFNLSAAGRKVFGVLVQEVQKTAINKDQVYLSEEVRRDISESYPDLKLSPSTYKRGIDDLVKNKVIARSTKTNIFFINPHLIFNGDRIAFTQAIKRKNKGDNKESPTETMERMKKRKEIGDDGLPI